MKLQKYIALLGSVALFGAFTHGCGDSSPRKTQRINCDSGELYNPETRECVEQMEGVNNSNNLNNLNNSNNANNEGPNNENLNNENPNNENPNNEDPNNENPNNENPNNENPNNENPNNENPNNENPNNENPNNENPNNENPNNENPNNENPNNENPNNDVGCGPDTQVFFGQIGGTGTNSGGSPSTNDYTANANLNSVLAEVPLTPDDLATPLVDEGVKTLSTPISVNGALVVATNFGTLSNRSFWLIDTNAAILVYLLSDPAPLVRVGDVVSFDALEVTNYEGHPEITELSNFSIGPRDQPVPYLDVSTVGLVASDYGRVVKFRGEIVSNGTPCGGTKQCYDIESDAGVTETYRSGGQYVIGDCVTFVGPMRSFPGPIPDPNSTMLQLDTFNSEWSRVD